MLAAFFANRLASRNETDRLLVPSGSDATNAAALWEAPEKDSENDSSFNAVVAAGISLLGQDWISDRLANLRVLGEVKPKDRHWYLSFVGTRPESRGKGLASTLIESVTNICDQEKIPAYLESSNPDNVSLYESHGFRVIGEAVIKDGPKVPLMWRDPLFE